MPSSCTAPPVALSRGRAASAAPYSRAPSTGVQLMPRVSNACARGSTRGRLPATHNSTASVIGRSPCGDSVAGRPCTLSVGASSPARSPKH
eukprot:1393350-Pleurochrysis_carterae.AAC.1